MSVEKVIRDGKVAVLVSPGFGAGWSTWAGQKLKNIAMHHPRFVEWVESGKKGNIEEIVKQVCGDEHFYVGGARDLEIEWLDVGTPFMITEYDGSESLETIAGIDWSVA